MLSFATSLNVQLSLEMINVAVLELQERVMWFSYYYKNDKKNLSWQAGVI